MVIQLQLLSYRIHYNVVVTQRSVIHYINTTIKDNKYHKQITI